MAETSARIVAHRGESAGGTAYEDLTAPFEAERVVLQPLCAHKLAPEKIVPLVRLSVARAELVIYTVPLLDDKLAQECTPGWVGTFPCARCVCERWSEILGGGPDVEGGVNLERLVVAEDVEGDDESLVHFVQANAPAFAFATASPLAAPAARFRLSGQAAALYLGTGLFVQMRQRLLSQADIAALFTVKVPQSPTAGTGEVLLLQDDALYDTEWVARFLGIKPGTLNNWISKGSIPCTKVGGKPRFMGKVLREWLQTRTTLADGAVDVEAPIDRFPWQKKQR